MNSISCIGTSLSEPQHTGYTASVCLYTNPSCIEQIRYNACMHAACMTSYINPKELIHHTTLYKDMYKYIRLITHTRNREKRNPQLTVAVIHAGVQYI